MVLLDGEERIQLPKRQTWTSHHIPMPRALHTHTLDPCMSHPMGAAVHAHFLHRRRFKTGVPTLGRPLPTHVLQNVMPDIPPDVYLRMRGARPPVRRRETLVPFIDDEVLAESRARHQPSLDVDGLVI